MTIIWAPPICRWTMPVVSGVRPGKAAIRGRTESQRLTDGTTTKKASYSLFRLTKPISIMPAQRAETLNRNWELTSIVTIGRLEFQELVVFSHEASDIIAQLPIFTRLADQILHSAGTNLGQG